MCVHVYVCMWACVRMHSCIDDIFVNIWSPMSTVLFLEYYHLSYEQ